ncbi:hypothetical protein CR513_55838, partial [Mucuna pruriens]
MYINYLPLKWLYIKIKNNEFKRKRMLEFEMSNLGLFFYVLDLEFVITKGPSSCTRRSMQLILKIFHM